MAKIVQEVLDWNLSATDAFSVEELAQLRYQAAPALIEFLQGSDGIVVVRALYELLRHGEEEKLRAIGKDPQVTQLWRHAIVATFSSDMFNMLDLGVFFKD